MSVPFAGQHRLRRIELVNWGTFHGAFTLDVPRSGLLVTGPSGSGKSTLLDALAAVLVPPLRLTFNAAAQEGSAGDRSRSLVSYVRGAHRREADDTTGEVATTYLRTGATWSGIALGYCDAAGTRTTLVRLMHLRNGSNSAADLTSAFVVVEGEVDLRSLETFAVNGIDQRRLKAVHPLTYADYSRFAARFRRRLGLASEQAQRLLHKTQSAKNLSSLDVLLREFMLDQPETFELAQAAVDQFGELSAAHESVVDARRQVEVLQPLRDYGNNLLHHRRDLAGIELQQRHLDTYVLDRRLHQGRHQLDVLSASLASLGHEHGRAEAQEAVARDERDSWQRQLDGSGGAELAALEAALASNTQLLDQRRNEHAARAHDAAALGIDLPASESGMTAFAAALAGIAAHLGDEDGRLRQARYRTIQHMMDRRSAVGGLADDLVELRRSKSNIDPQLLRVRSALAADLGVPAEDLPFAGELVEIRPQQARWTGAIERVLRPLARTLLVADDLYAGVVGLVDARHLGTRLVFERTLPLSDDGRAVDPRSLVDKLELAEHRHSAWLAVHLRRRFDYACVEHPGELVGLTRAVSLAGQIKHSDSRHEKDDRFAIDDRRQWQLGWSIERKAQLLTELLDRASQELAAAEQAVTSEESAARELGERLAAARRLEGMAWTSIDVADLAARIEGQQRSIDRIRSRPDVAELERRCREATATLVALQAALRQLGGRLERLGQDEADLQAHLARWEQARSGLDDVGAEAATALAALFEAHADPDGLLATARQVADTLAHRAQRVQAAANRLIRNIEQVMGTYKHQWEAQAADLAPQEDYLADFLAVLDRLQSDRLPDFEKRFFDLLARQSRNNIGQLAVRIHNSRREIRTRIDPINDSLRRTEYAPGRHLQVRVKDRSAPEVTEFLAELAAITSGSIEDSLSSDASESSRREAEERFVRMRRLLARLSSSDPVQRRWRSECLDTRLHVQFIAEVKDADGRPVDYYVGAGGLSGGERQKLVVFCLAAALRYQLAPDGADQPAYALVVLDEAFDKTDPEFTRAGLDVFAAFGFQLLLATPLKMLQTLEDYVGGAALVLNDPDTGSRFEVIRFDQPEPVVEEPAVQESLL